MTIENQVASDSATQINETAATITPEIVAPDVEGQEPQELTKVEAPAELTDAQKEAKALRRRVDRMTQQKYQLVIENQQLRNRPAEQRDPTQEPQFDARQLDVEIQRRAEQIAHGQTHAKKLDEVEAEIIKNAGDSSYKDFMEDLESAGKPAQELVNIVLELEDSAKLLTHFVNDRDELDRVLKMSPARQAAHMGKLSAQLENKPRVSAAPKPLEPLSARTTARTTSTGSDEDMVRAIRNSR